MDGLASGRICSMGAVFGDGFDSTLGVAFGLGFGSVFGVGFGAAFGAGLGCGMALGLGSGVNKPKSACAAKTPAHKVKTDNK